jgi:hypothetical protein
VSHTPEIDDLIETVRKALETAFRRGVTASAKDTEAVKKQVLDALGISIPVSAEASRRTARAKKSDPKGARAPKGAVSEAVDAVFKEGMTTKEVQQAATTHNPLVNPKSVYNELWREKTPYEQRDEKWYRTSSPAPPAPDVAPTAAPPVTGAPSVATAPLQPQTAAPTPQPTPAAATPTASVAPSVQPTGQQAQPSAQQPVQITPVAIAAASAPVQPAVPQTQPVAATPVHNPNAV